MATAVQVRDAILKSLREKRSKSEQELADATKAPEVQRYLGLHAGIGLLDEAIMVAQGELDAAKAVLAPKPPAIRVEMGKSVKSRQAAWGTVLKAWPTSTGGKEHKLTNIYSAPYRAMLEEYRGQQAVLGITVLMWFRRQFGIPPSAARAYLYYGRERKTVAPHAEAKDGRVYNWDFPSRYAGGVNDGDKTPEPDMEELRKAGLVH